MVGFSQNVWFDPGSFIKLLQSKIPIISFMTLLILIFPQTFSSLCWLRIIIHIRFSLLRYAYRNQRSHCFSNFSGLIPVAL